MQQEMALLHYLVVLIIRFYQAVYHTASNLIDDFQNEANRYNNGEAHCWRLPNLAVGISRGKMKNLSRLETPGSYMHEKIKLCGTTPWSRRARHRATHLRMVATSRLT